MTDQTTIRNLLFLDPALQPAGVEQVTVRKGDKWLDAEGEEVSIRETGREDVEIARGRIIGTTLVRLDQVPEEDLKREHAESCRTPLGLGIAMGRAYPDITPSDLVTVVRFEVL